MKPMFESQSGFFNLRVKSYIGTWLVFLLILPTAFKVCLQLPAAR